MDIDMNTNMRSATPKSMHIVWWVVTVALVSVCTFVFVQDVAHADEATGTNRPVVTTKADAVAKVSGKWEKWKSGWYFKKTDGTYATGFIQPNSDKRIYYLNNKGLMKTGWVKVNGKWYWAASNGALHSGWKKLKGKWYYLDPKVANHPAVTGFFSDGKARYYCDPTSCAMKTGWIKSGEKWYWAKSNGALVSGWKKLDAWYYLDPTQENYPAVTGLFTVKGVDYFAKPDCRLVQNAWAQVSAGQSRFADASGALQNIFLEKVGGKQYAKDKNGKTLSGWNKLGTKWIYCDPKQNSALATGWIQPDGKTWYYMNASGIMQEGWVKTGGKFYYLTPGSGAWKKNIPSLTENYRKSFVHGNKPAQYQKYIVLHDTEGSGTANSVIDWWDSNGNRVAAHFVINKDGSVVQCVPLDKIAHHAGYGDSGHNKYYGVTDESRDDKKGTKSVGSWAADYGMNSYSIGIEMVHRGGETYPKAQLESLDRIIAYIDSYYGFESKIIDHKAWRTGNSDTSPEFATYLANYKKYRSYKR